MHFWKEIPAYWFFLVAEIEWSFCEGDTEYFWIWFVEKTFSDVSHNRFLNTEELLADLKAL